MLHPFPGLQWLSYSRSTHSLLPPFSVAIGKWFIVGCEVPASTVYPMPYGGTYLAKYLEEGATPALSWGTKERSPIVVVVVVVVCPQGKISQGGGFSFFRKYSQETRVPYYSVGETSITVRKHRGAVAQKSPLPLCTFPLASHDCRTQSKTLSWALISFFVTCCCSSPPLVLLRLLPTRRGSLELHSPPRLPYLMGKQVLSMYICSSGNG